MLARFHSRQPQRGQRRGMTIVESVLVMGVFLLLLMGIFEYCRFLLVLHVTNNAARDGARYAAVRVNTDAAMLATVKTQIINYTKARMGGVHRQLWPTTDLDTAHIAVYAVDQSGLDQTPPILRAKTTSAATPKAYPDPFAASDPLAVAWNTVGFTERIAVTIRGTYKPLMPTFLLMPKTIPINVTAIMAGES